MKNRQQWTAMLAKLVAPMDATRAAKALSDMLPMLADFPDAAFCIGSLDAVATKCKFAPSYAELRGHLADWWKQHRPAPIAITAAEHSAADKKLVTDRENRESWEGITAAQVRAKVAAIRVGILPQHVGHWFGTALEMYAPQHLGLLPPEWLTKPPDEPANVVKLRTAAADIRFKIRKGKPLDD